MNVQAFFFKKKRGGNGETECTYNALYIGPSIAAFWLSCKCRASCDIYESGWMPLGCSWKVLFL